MSDNEAKSTLEETSLILTETKEAFQSDTELIGNCKEDGSDKEIKTKTISENESISKIKSNENSEDGELPSDDGELPESDGEIDEPEVSKQPSADNFNLGENHGDELDYDEFDLHNNPNENKNSISKELEDGEISDGEIVSDDEGKNVNKTPVKVKPVVEKEEGEMSSDGEEVGIPSDEVCKFFKRGSCRWGAMCKFRHSEDPNTSGNYSMFESFQTPVKPSPRKPQEKSNAASAASKPAIEETAWQKGLREMKEMKLRSKQRKAYDPEFHRKREVVNLNQDINKDDEIDGAGGRNFHEFNTKGYDPLAELEDDERYSAPTIQEINRMKALKLQQRGRQMGPSPMHNYNQGRQHPGYGVGYSAPPVGRYPYDGSRIQHDGRYPPAREQQMRRSPYKSLERRNDNRGGDRDFRNDRDFRSDQYRNNGNNWNGRPINDGPNVDKFGRNIDRRQRPDSESSQSGSRYVTMEKRGDQWSDPWIRQSNNRRRSRNSSSSGSSSGYSRPSSRSSSGSSSRSSSSSSSASSRSSSSSRSPSPTTRKIVKVKQEKKVEIKNEKPTVSKIAQPRKVTVGIKRLRESSSDEFSNSDSETQPAPKKKKSPIAKKARKDSSSSGSSSGSESYSSGSSSSGSSSDSDSSSGSSSDSDGENKASVKRYGNIDHDRRKKAAKLDPAHQRMIHEKQKQIQQQLRSVETAIRKKRAKLN